MEEFNLKNAMLIFNPSSGKEEAEKYKKRTVTVLEGLDYNVIVKETKKAKDATEFASLACVDKLDFLLAMGGDGTVNEVINGLAEKEYRPLFSFIPLGTVNDLARALGIPLDPELAIEALKMPNTEWIDIAKIEEKYFMNIVAIGEVASRVADTSVERKTKFGSLAYLIEGAKAIISHEENEMTITHDQGIWKGSAMLVLVALTNSVAGFEKMAPNAEVNDGFLHVFIIKEAGIPTVIKMGAKILLGTLEEDKGVEVIQTTQVVIESAKTLTCNVDGDEGTSTPVRLKVLPRHLELLVPKKVRDFKS